MKYLISKDFTSYFPFYFYKTTNLINNKIYYGSGCRENYLGSGVHLHYAIKKYDKEK